MSRSFDGSTQYGTHAGAAITAPPFTVAAWCYWDGTGSSHKIVFSTGNTTSGHTYRFGAQVDTGYLSGRSDHSGGSSSLLFTGATFSASTWFHAAFVVRSTTDVQGYLNGSSVGTSADFQTPTSVNQMRIASVSRDTGSGPGLYWPGLLAHVAVWNNDQTSNVAALAGGDNPLAYSSGLVAYWPLAGTTSPEPDDAGSYDMTLTGSPPQGGSDPTVDAPPGGSVSSPPCQSALLHSILRGRLAR